MSDSDCVENVGGTPPVFERDRASLDETDASALAARMLATGAPACVTVVLADPYPVVCLGLMEALAVEKDLEVLACVQDAAEAIRAVREFQPRVIVLDLDLPSGGGIELIRELRLEGLATRPVVFTAPSSKKMALEVVRLGVHGVVTKDMDVRWLVHCIREVDAGRQWLEKEVAVHAVGQLLESEDANRNINAVLTSREMEIARMVSQGLPNKTVAGQFEITEGTVKLHLHHIYQKLQCKGRVGLMRYMQKAEPF